VKGQRTSWFFFYFIETQAFDLLKLSFIIFYCGSPNIEMKQNNGQSFSRTSFYDLNFFFLFSIFYAPDFSFFLINFSLFIKTCTLKTLGKHFCFENTSAKH